MGDSGVGRSALKEEGQIETDGRNIRIAENASAKPKELAEYMVSLGREFSLPNSFVNPARPKEHV